jgi:hypothetical protein
MRLYGKCTAMVDWLKSDPHEVEWIVNNLYDRMGFKSILTSLSKDGGVDVFANHFDQETRSYLKCIIQVKRWKNPLGVKAVRELLGVKDDQKADKAIMVSISGYAKTAKEFANRHSMELIDKDVFEEMLGNAQLLRVDGSLVSPSDPNLPPNRRKSIHQLLLESRPEGLSREEIIERIFSPRFRITVKKEVLNQDIDELSRRGEIIEDEEKYYLRISDDEISRISQSLSSEIENLAQIFTEKDIHDFLNSKYKLPLPTISRLVPVREIIEQLVMAGKINKIVDGVFVSPRTLTRVRKFHWTRESLQKNILTLMHIPSEILEDSIEEVRTKMGFPMGGITKFFSRNPLERMPFMLIGIHFCKEQQAGFIQGTLLMPLFVNPAQALTKKELNSVRLRIQKTSAVNKGRPNAPQEEKGKSVVHVIAGAGIKVAGLKLFEEKAKQIYQYGSTLINLVEDFHLDDEFVLACAGSEICILAIYNFQRKEKFKVCLDKLLDKAEILQKFLIKAYEQCPPFIA